MTTEETQVAPPANPSSVTVARPILGRPAVLGMIDSVLVKLINFKDDRRLGTLCIGVASNRRGVGVSTVTYRLASQAALNGEGSVLIVDANDRNPSQHSLSDATDGPGLIDHLADGIDLDKCIQKSATKYLDVLPWGSIKVEDYSVSPVVLQGLFSDLRNRYQVILIDLPVLDEAGSAIFYSMMSDGVVLVLDGVTSKATSMKELVDKLEEHSVTVLGAIMNRYKPALPAWLRRWF